MHQESNNLIAGKYGQPERNNVEKCLNHILILSRASKANSKDMLGCMYLIGGLVIL